MTLIDSVRRHLASASKEAIREKHADALKAARRAIEHLNEGIALLEASTGGEIITCAFSNAQVRVTDALAAFEQANGIASLSTSATVAFHLCGSLVKTAHAAA